VRSLKRDDRAARALGRLRGGSLKVEQYAFGFSLQRDVLRLRPDVIYFSEWYTGVALNSLRRLNRQQYALVLSNGSMAAEGFEPFDRVHQHTAPALEYVLTAAPTRSATSCCRWPSTSRPTVPGADERLALRGSLGLPTDRPIVTCVAALNRYHKRLDYLISEVARLPEPRPFCCWSASPSRRPRRCARSPTSCSATTGHSFRTVQRSEVDGLLRASDAFVLASLAEGLPRALVEAMSHGLRCLAHDYSVARFALGEHGRLADLTQPGALAGLLQETFAVDEGPEAAAERRRFVDERFSWAHLRPRYVEMLTGAVGRAPF
jgi:glycosyltransferase involved in cell wall biosynthesis